MDWRLEEDGFAKVVGGETTVYLDDSRRSRMRSKVWTGGGAHGRENLRAVVIRKMTGSANSVYTSCLGSLVGSREGSQMLRAGPLSSEDQSLVLVCPGCLSFLRLDFFSGLGIAMLVMSLHILGEMGKLCWEWLKRPLPSFSLLESREG